MRETGEQQQVFCAMTKEIEVKSNREKMKQKQKYKKYISKNAAKLQFVVGAVAKWEQQVCGLSLLFASLLVENKIACRTYPTSLRFYNSPPSNNSPY